MADNAAQTYATAVARGTGLSLATVLAWMRGENGPDNNFLGVKDPSTGRIDSYPSPELGAAAAVRTLHQKNFAPVLTVAAQTQDPKAELTAIAQSPWQDGPKDTYLTLLLGSLADNSRDGGGIHFTGGNTPATQAPNTPSNLLPSGTGISLTGWTADLTNWLTQEASLGLAYVILTFLGIAFVLIGVLDVFGVSPATIVGRGVPAGSPTSNRLAAGDTVPF